MLTDGGLIIPDRKILRDWRDPRQPRIWRDPPGWWPCQPSCCPSSSSSSCSSTVCGCCIPDILCAHVSVGDCVDCPSNQYSADIALCKTFGGNEGFNIGQYFWLGNGTICGACAQVQLRCSLNADNSLHCPRDPQWRVGFFMGGPSDHDGNGPCGLGNSGSACLDQSCPPFFASFPLSNSGALDPGCCAAASISIDQSGCFGSCVPFFCGSSTGSSGGCCGMEGTNLTCDLSGADILTCLCINPASFTFFWNAGGFWSSNPSWSCNGTVVFLTVTLNCSNGTWTFNGNFTGGPCDGCFLTGTSTNATCSPFDLSMNLTNSCTGHTVTADIT